MALKQFEIVSLILRMSTNEIISNFNLNFGVAGKGHMVYEMSGILV